MADTNTASDALKKLMASTGMSKAEALVRLEADDVPTPAPVVPVPAVPEVPTPQPVKEPKPETSDE